VTLKFIDAHGDNENIDIGTVGIIGTMDCSVTGELVGPKAAELGVFKGPPPLVNKIEDNDDVELVNTNKCLMFITNDEVKISYIESLASQIKDRIITFKVSGSDVWPSRLTQYLFEEELDDQIVLTNMAIPKGYK